MEEKIKGSIDKAFFLLDCLAVANRPMSLKELAEEMDAPKSTVHGILLKLCNLDAVFQDAHTGRYSLGIRLFELGNAYSQSLDIVKIARPIVKEAMEATQKSVHIMMLRFPWVVLVCHFEPLNARLKMLLTTGTRLPLYSNPHGKLFLSYMSDSRVREYLKTCKIKRHTDWTVTDPEAIIKQLHRFHRQGYAEDHNERNIGMHGIAAPIVDHQGEILYSLAIVGMCNKKEDNDVPVMIDWAVKAADQISVRLWNKR